MLQLVFDDLTFNNEGFKTYFKDQDYHPPHNKDYNTIAIIGCQSSGKSTLLNHIFGTNFEVMNDENGRGQTTKGIWISTHKETNTILFDVEGTDAKERGDNRFKFEQCSSLFALAMADVLMINMWTSDIGRYTASNYGVLKVVFEMNLKLFQQESAKKIVVVLRDFDENNDDKEKLAEGIFGDLKQIWGEIKKPEKYANCSPEKFFKFEFFTLPHKFYFPDKFDEGIKDIQKRLKKIEGEDNKFLFDHVNYNKNVPIDGLFKYTWDMWSNIINNKDLNIPGQKEMLAEFRCNELKDAALAEVEQEISDLETESTVKKIGDFKDRVKRIVDKALNTYDETAHEYIPHIYQDIRKQLDNTLNEKIYPSFASQMKKLIPVYQKNFRAELEKASGKNENFSQVSQQVKEKFMNQLRDELKDIQFYDSWDVGEDNEALFDEIIENQRQIQIEVKKEEVVKKILNLLEDCVQNRFDSLNEEFWTEVNQDFVSNFRNIIISYNAFLDAYFKITEEEEKAFTKGCEDNVYTELKKEFFRHNKDIISYATDNFKKSFWYDEGIPRPWNKMLESQIDQLYEKNKAQNLTLLDMFEYFKMIKNPLALIEYKKVEEEEFNKIVNEMIPKMVKSKDTQFEKFLTPEDIKGMKLRYSDEIKEIYDDAKRRHFNIKQSSVPLWAWIILIYLGYDDVWKMLTGYWLIPMILLVGGYGVLHLLGLGHLPFMIINILKAQFQGKPKQN